MLVRTLHQMISGIEHKQCSKCWQFKELNLFNKGSNTWDGLYPSCKCCKKKTNNYVPKKQPDKIIDDQIWRLCHQCDQWKELLLFVKDERKCKDCKSLANTLYYENNKTIINSQSSQYYQEHKSEIQSRHKLWVDENRDYLSEYGKEYREQNKEKLKEYDRQKHHKYKKNINYRITKNMRRRVLDAVKGNPKSSTTLNLIGCNITIFKQHLEKIFQDGMTWDNYGQWHIDHIIPCASFDLSKEEERKKCFHYTNMQPLWKRDNLKKGAKVS